MSEALNPTGSPVTPFSTPAITTPLFDTLMTGGLSIAFMGSILVYVLFMGGRAGFVDADWLTLAILINGTHFMASYRLLYTSKARVVNHRWSAVYVPAGLVTLLTFAAIDFHREVILDYLLLGGSIYLAWHYTGQTWGMVSVFTRLAKVDLTRFERHSIRVGIQSLLVMHVLFALSGRLPPSQIIAPQTYMRGFEIVFWSVCGIIALSFLAGAYAFFAIRTRHETMPWRAVIAWFSLFLWYPFWYFIPGGFLWVQLSHALQYLGFPLRVDLNGYTQKARRTRSQKRIHVLSVYALLATCGVLFLYGPELATRAFGVGWYSETHLRMLFTGWVHCIGIHHYFIDGALWKLRDPGVQSALFSHLTPTAR